MEIVHRRLNRWDRAVCRYHEWRLETTHVNMTLLALVFAGLTGLGAFIRVYTPISPIPFTAQTFFVLLSGIMLGHRWGAASQMLYVSLGLAGVPWFAGGHAGVGVLMGPTGGYLVGFILASAFLGHVVDARDVIRGAPALVGLMLLASLLVLTSGTIWLVALGLTPAQALLYGFLPFLAVEAVKATLAGGTATFLTSGRSVTL